MYKFPVIYKITTLTSQRKDWPTWQEVESALLVYPLISLCINRS